VKRILGGKVQEYEENKASLGDFREECQHCLKIFPKGHIQSLDEARIERLARTWL
jgi:hypothetical protein